MTVKDILPDREVEIMVRTNGLNDNDMLFGYCKWTGEELVSLDGDSYFLDEKVTKYEYLDDGSLVYWIYSEWV